MEITLHLLCTSLSNEWPPEYFDAYYNLSEADQATVEERHAYLIASRNSGMDLAIRLASFMNGEDQAAIDAFIKQLTITEHRTLQQSVFRLFLRVIKAWAKRKELGSGYYDLRNEFTAETSKKIVDLLDGQMPPFI